jgi:hypothetical protein
MKMFFSGFSGSVIFACTILICGHIDISMAQPVTSAAPTPIPQSTGKFEGLIPPAGTAVINPAPASKEAPPATPPVASIQYGTAKPDGEDTHPALSLTADKAELVRLDADAASVIVGNPDTVNIQLENRRLLIVTPHQPGTTYLSILNDSGNVIMQRHIIVSAPKANYIRIRRSCAGQASGCQESSVYYCPGMCHPVGSSAAMPSGAVSAQASGASPAASGGSTDSMPPAGISAADVPHPTVSVNPVSPITPGY